VFLSAWHGLRSSYKWVRHLTVSMELPRDPEELRGVDIVAFSTDGDRLCGLVARVPGYRSKGPGSIPGATRFSEK
jgi:hypothetical protein